MLPELSLKPEDLTNTRRHFLLPDLYYSYMSPVERQVKTQILTVSEVSICYALQSDVKSLIL